MRTLLLLIVLAPTVAWAGDDAAFVTLDRADGVSRAGVEAAFVALDDVGEDGGQSAMRFEAHAQSVNERTGLGAYGTVPVAVYRRERDSATGSLGNIELGGLLARPLRPGLDLIVHAGAVLPSSAPDSDRGVELSQLGRQTDALLVRTPPIALRLAGALRYRHDALVARVELGLDQTFVRFDKLDYAAGLRIGGAVGWDLGVALPAVEVVTLFNSPTNGRATYAAALSIRARAGRVQPYAALIAPLQDVLPTAAVAIGVDVVLP